jgi:hypothetical protein
MTGHLALGQEPIGYRDLNEGYTVFRAAQLPYVIAAERATFVEYTNSHKFLLRDDIGTLQECKMSQRNSEAWIFGRGDCSCFQWHPYLRESFSETRMWSGGHDRFGNTFGQLSLAC